MTDPVIRAAQRTDIEAIIALALQGQIIGSTDNAADWADESYQFAFSAIEANPNEELYVLERDGKVIGTFQLTFLPGLMRRGMTRGQVEAVFIAEHLRGQGLGRRMMKWAVNRCRERGCGMVQLTSNKKRVDAHRFYESLGFAKSHEGFKLYL
jgi:GNAT superfamily N-acetyltransferase